MDKVGDKVGGKILFKVEFVMKAKVVVGEVMTNKNHLNLLPRFSYLFYCQFLFFSLCLYAEAFDYLEVPKKVTPFGHSHNDFSRDSPLYQALALGFPSLEIDIHLKGGILYVAHHENEIQESKTLETLYLLPLKELIEKGGGQLYASGEPLQLLIDIKTKADSTYAALKTVLLQYQKYLHVFDARDPREPNQPREQGPRPLKIVLSGNRPLRDIKKDPFPFAGLDARPNEKIEKSQSSLFPLISDSWLNHFYWNGRGNFSESERKKLQKMVNQFHQEGRKVRFWDTPDHPQLWEELLKAKVDYINVDDLPQYKKFIDQKNL